MVAAEQRQALVKRRGRIAVAVVPQLGRDERVRALQPVADAALVAVDRGGVDQPEAAVEAGTDDRRRVGVGQLVGAHAECGDRAAVVEGEVGHDTPNPSAAAGLP